MCASCARDQEARLGVGGQHLVSKAVCVHSVQFATLLIHKHTKRRMGAISASIKTVSSAQLNSDERFSEVDRWG
jgi:hypothetical protein